MTAPAIITLSFDDCLHIIQKNPHGDLDLSHMRSPFSLPEGIVVPGNLILQNCCIEHLPKIHVKGDTLCDGSLLQSIADGCVFDGNVELSNTPLTVFPGNTIIRGNLIAFKIHLEEFRENLTVMGDASFASSTLPAFPRFCRFMANLDCTDCVFSDPAPFPAGFDVSGTLFLCGAKLERLPFSFSCDNLTATYTRFRFSPGTVIRKNARLSHSHITGVPEEISFEGNVYLNQATLSSLPRKLRFGGDLHLAGCSLESIPDGTHIRGNLFLRNSHVQDIGRGVIVEGDVFLPERSMICGLDRIARG